MKSVVRQDVKPSDSDNNLRRKNGGFLSLARPPLHNASMYSPSVSHLVTQQCTGLCIMFIFCDGKYTY